MEQNDHALMLAVHISDVLDVISTPCDPRLVFRLYTNDGTFKCYVCKSFSLTLNHLFILELEEVDHGWIMNDNALTFMNSATKFDILETIEELRVGENWCGFCRLPDGNFAVITNEIFEVEDKYSIINILSMNNRRNE